MYKNYIGERLKYLRKSCGYSQTNIATVIGVDRTTYSCYERGITVPDAECCFALSRLYNIKVTDLLDAESKVFSDISAPARSIPKTNVSSPSIKDINKVPELTKTEKQLICLYRSFTEEQRKKMYEALEKIYKL